MSNRILVPADQDQFLKIAAADGQYHAPTDRELLNEWLRNLRSCGRDKDHVIWSLGSVPKGAIGYYNFNVRVAQAGEALTSHLGQLRVAFDTDDAGDDFSQQSSLITRASAKFQRVIFRAKLRRLQHRRHDIRLGDRLRTAYP